MNILFIGDIVGSPGRNAVKEILPRLKNKYALDFVIANAENASGGSGLTPKSAQELFSYGIDVLTNGDHVFKKREIIEAFGSEKRMLRPANFPAMVPGKGGNVFETAGGKKVGVINVAGRVFMPPLDCPFTSARGLVEGILKETNIIIVDIHAEATSEKVAFGWFLDGVASAVVGTHTHIQTADERILPRGTAYITDVGMCGPMDSVIGRRIEDVLERFLTQIPAHFNVAEENVQMHGVLLDIDAGSGKAKNITRIQERL